MCLPHLGRTWQRQHGHIVFFNIILVGCPVYSNDCLLGILWDILVSYQTLNLWSVGFELGFPSQPGSANSSDSGYRAQQVPRHWRRPLVWRSWKSMDIPWCLWNCLWWIKYIYILNGKVCFLKITIETHGIKLKDDWWLLYTMVLI